MGQEQITAPQNIISEIEYNGYVALIAHIDGEKYFRERQDGDRPLTHFTKSGDILTVQCAKYRRALNKYSDRFKNVNKNETSKTKGNDKDEEKFKDFLYTPASFIAFGNNDNIAITVADDFAFTERLAMLSNVPVRQTSLAFCPKLESLGIKRDIFCELDDICNPPEAKLTDQDLEKLTIGKLTGRDIQELEDKLTYKDIERRMGKVSSEEIDKLIEKLRAPELPFMKEHPLLAVTYCKLNGMAVLGPGLLMQQAVYKAMAKKIRETWEILNTKTDGEEGQGDPFYTDILSNRDVKSFQCAFLDPQGWADVVILMFCRNYSVMISILAALRCLTMEDLYDKETGGETLKDAVGCFGLHEKIAGAAKIMQKQNVNPLLSANHVFCSTYTTLGMSHRAFAQSDPTEAREYYNVDKNIVIADTHLNLCCGHFLTAKEEVKKKTKAKFKTSLEPIYSWYMVGHNDFSYQQLLWQDQDMDRNKAVHLFDLVQQIKNMRDFPKNENQNSESFFATHLYESSTDLRVPMPICLPDDPRTYQGIALPKIKMGEHVEIRLILDEIRKKLFEGKPHLLLEERGELPKNFNIKFLLKKLIQIRLPSPLSNAILYLYTDFSNYLSDSFLFDSVVDLYDIFTATYRLLTKELPQLLVKLKDEIGKTLEDESELVGILDPICRSFLSDRDIDNILKLLELLQNALANRVQIAFQDAERWNTSVDVRGIGLNRILNAADAPLKCGLGVLRRVMIGVTKAFSPKNTNGRLQKSREEIDRDSRTRVGGASAVTYNPRSLFRRLSIGSNPEFFLTSIDLNISHLTRPRAFYIHFHETAHLICNLLRSNVPCEHKEYKCSRSQNVTCHKTIHKIKNEFDYANFERYEEIFVEMLVHKFIFEDDRKTYFRNYVANYSLDPIAYCRKNSEAFLRMFEMLFRGFLITDPLRPESKEQQVYSGDRVNLSLITNRAFDRFWKAVEDAGPFFFDFKHLWYVASKERIESYFTPAYREAYHPMCCIWNDVQRIYDGVCIGNETKKNFGTDPDPHHKKNLIRMIENGLSAGKPLIRVLYKDPRRDESVEENGRLDPFFLMRHLLREHIKKIYGEGIINPKEQVIYLTRDFNGDPIEPPEGGKLHSQLLDRTLNGLVSAVPESRKEFMRNRITVIKTLWDISTNLRARRMKDILKSVYPELCQTE